MKFTDALMHAVDTFAKGLGIVIDWTNENIIPYLMDLFSRYIGYNITIQILTMVVSICVMGGCVWVWKYLAKRYKEDNYADFTMEIMLAGFIFMGSIFFVGVSVYKLIQIIFLPELYIYYQLIGQ